MWFIGGRKSIIQEIVHSWRQFECEIKIEAWNCNSLYYVDSR
jgi:hypothetical protein